MTGFKQNLAIVIGINHYGNGISSLHTAITDATAIAQILQDEHDYKVESYLNEAATLANLTGLLKQLHLDRDDRLLFYFAGHGIALNGDEGPQGYLIPQDARLGDVSTYLPMTQVEAALSQLPCRHCLVILDCCFAGAFRWSSTRKLVPITEVIHKERYDRFIQDSAWQVITSASHDQYALDALELKNDRGIDPTRIQHSPFAVALMDALSGSADIYPPSKHGQPAGDGVITATELYLYVREIVEPATDARNLRQTPGLWCLKKHDKGEFIFLTPGHVLNLPPAPSLNETEENNPYRGLKSYEKEHSALFFGRTALIENLCDFVCSHPFTVVLGASGSGKSSLVKAGLVPHLEGFKVQRQQPDRKLKREVQPHQHKHQQWRILATIRPGEVPLAALKDALQEGKLFTADKSQESILEAQVLTSAIQDWSQHHPDTKLLLLIDQAEELITQCRNEQEREQFLQLITYLWKECSDCIHIVLTLRSDFEPQFSEHPALKSEWISSRFVVPAMTREELRDAIEEPASTKVVYFETDEQRGNLVDQLINEVAAMPGALPLLSFALSELYFKLAHRFLQSVTTGDISDRLITWQDYDELGGVTRSVTEKADHEYEVLVQKDAVYAQTIRNVMLRMVNIDGGSATKRKVPRLELQYPEQENDRVNQVTEQFTQARLLVPGNDRGIPYIEPAHDALIHGWKKLSDWIQSQGENLTLQQQLTPAAVYWQQNQQRTRFLWHNNPRLSLLRQKNTAHSWLNQLEQTFVQRSIRQRQLNTLRNGGIFASIVLLGVIGTVSWRNSQINRMLDLQGSAEERLLRNQNLEALIESIKAAKSLQNPLLQMFPPTEARRNEVQETLQNAVYQVRERSRLVPEQGQGNIQSIAFSPDGQLIATAHENGTVNFWNRSGQLLSGFNTPNVGSIQGISFTVDSQYLVAKTYDATSYQTVGKRWNLQGDLQLEESPDVQSLGFNLSEDTVVDESPFNYVAYSPDSTLAASAEIHSGTLSIYQFDFNGDAEQLLDGVQAPRFNSNGALNIRFSPDGQRVVAASPLDNRIYLWDLGGNRLAQFEHVGGVQDLKFSPDGQQLATVGLDGVVRIWQNLEGSQLQEFRGYSGQDWVKHIRLSPTTNQVAIGLNSGMVRVWNLSTQQETQLPNPESVDGLRFSPDDRFLAVGSGSGKTWVWNLDTQQISPAMPGPELAEGTLQRDLLGTSYWGADFSPDSQWLVLGGGNTAAHNILQPEQQVMLPEEEDNGEEGDLQDLAAGWLHSFAFNSAQQLLATGGLEGQLHLWDWQQLSEMYGYDLQQLSAITGYEQFWSREQLIKQEITTHMPIRDVVLSPDGNLVATAGIDSGAAIVRLWNSTGQQQAELRGHESAIHAVVFSADGQRLATASEDGTARLWDLSGQQLAVFQGHNKVQQIAFNGDGNLITVGFSNPKEGQASVYDLWQVKTWQIQNLDQLLIQGCSWIQGYLENSRDLDNRPEFQTDRTLCKGILSTATEELAPATTNTLTPVEPTSKSIITP